MEDARKHPAGETVRQHLGLSVEKWIATVRYLVEKGQVRINPLYEEENIEITVAGIDAYESIQPTGS